MKLVNQEYIRILHETPSNISKIYSSIINSGKYKTPRKASVLKLLKDNFVHLTGYSFKEFTEEQQKEILRIAEDTYEGIRG